MQGGGTTEPTGAPPQARRLLGGGEAGARVRGER